MCAKTEGATDICVFPSNVHALQAVRASVPQTLDALLLICKFSTCLRLGKCY